MCFGVGKQNKALKVEKGIVCLECGGHAHLGKQRDPIRVSLQNGALNAWPYFGPPGWAIVSHGRVLSNEATGSP